MSKFKTASSLTKALEGVCYHRRVNLVFDDFLEICVCCFTRGAMETRYFEIIKNYSKDELNQISKCLGLLIAEYENEVQSGTWTDALGHTFEEINSTSVAQALGQFFTPVHICNLMAQLVSDENGGRISDPSCGSGRNLIAHKFKNIEVSSKSFYYAQDLDRRCVLMSIINLFLYGMHGVVLHQNTLSMEIYGGYYISDPRVHVGVIPLSKEECEQMMIRRSVQKKEVVIPVSPSAGVQGVLAF
jgi:type I restriction enzyme M protein